MTTQRGLNKALPTVFLEAKNRNPSHVAVHAKINGHWQEYSWPDYFQMAESLGGGLLSLGVKKEDRVAICANTRFEWCQCDQAILGVGGITVPIYQSNLPEEIAFILNNSETKILILENLTQFNKWQTIQAQCPSVQHVVVMEDFTSRPKAVLSLDELKAKGHTHLKAHPADFQRLSSSVQLEDPATILYTSGTTGQPKGVLLCHEQIMSEVSDTFDLVGVTDQDCTLSFLPYAHILGRVESWGHVYTGCGLAFAESIDKIRFNLCEIRPTVMIAVPRIFEKIYNGIQTQLEANPLKKRIFDWAVSVGRQVSALRRSKMAIPLHTLGQYLVARRLVFDGIIEKLGGRMRFAVSGGAPLSRDIGEFFHAVGLLILEGYGLTETTAAVTINTPFDYEFGTVGKPIGDVQIKMASDGEILVKSKKVMREYYKNPEATREVMSDGFFATGDIGEFTDSGNLKITDRKKDLIKTAGGKYVAPQRLENLLKLNRFVSNVHIHGDQRKYVVALVTMHEQNLKDFASQKSLGEGALQDLVKLPEVNELIRDAIAEANSHLASFETIKNFAILAEDFTVENGLLTPSLKVKRKVADKKFKNVLDHLYGENQN